MKKNKKKDSKINYKKISRDIYMEQGANDGRFTTKVVKNKKKETSKKACRVKLKY